MSSVFLMASPAAPTMNRSSVASSSDTASSVSAAPFSLSLADWQVEWQTATVISRLMTVAPPYLQPYWQCYFNRQQKSDIQSLYDSFRELVPAAQAFNTSTFDSLMATAQGVIIYAQTVVPKNYGRMRDILAAAETTAPSSTDQLEFMNLLQDCIRDVSQQSVPAQYLQKQLQAYSQSLQNFTTTFNQTPHNAAQIVADSGQVPIGVDSNNNVVGTSSAPTDDNKWFLLWDPRNACRLIMPSRPNMCLAPNVPRNFREVIGNPFFPYSYFTCHLEPVDLADPFQLWTVDPTAQRTEITYMMVDGMCLDIAGNSGWGPGTSVLGFRKNGGSNQHWTFTPKLLQFWDESFYNAVGPIARDTHVVTAIEKILGCWQAVSDDLNAVKTAVQTQFDLKQPFISGLNVDATIASWAQTAKEAQAFIENAEKARQQVG